jgi:predicted amidohydrolase
MQVIAVQLDSVWENKEASHERVRRLLAAVQIVPGALIVLPEMFDTGFSMDVTKTAQTDARESESFLCWVAREHQAAVLGGVVGPAIGGVASNEAVCFAPDGSVLVRYRKMQPFTLAGEDLKYGCGDHHCVFSWQGLRIAPFICYDLRFPERFRPAARDGAELITVSACWPMARSEHWVRLLQARAIENLAYVVGVNRCGTEPTLKYDGRSAAFDHMGVPLFEADAAEQVLTTEVDVEAIRAWRERFPALRDMSVC